MVYLHLKCCLPTKRFKINNLCIKNNFSDENEQVCKQGHPLFSQLFYIECMIATKNYSGNLYPAELSLLRFVKCVRENVS